jgi:uncharacterized membrane protein
MAPSSSASSSTTTPTVRTVGVFQCFAWLALGWKDLCRTGAASVAHGLVLAVFGGALLWIAHQRFWFLAGAFSGFLVIAPVLATSLYAMSRALERKETAGWTVVGKTWLNWQGSHLNKWGNDYWCMVQFGALLALAATGWVLTSAALITLLSPAPVHTPLDFVRTVVLARDNWVFELWLAMGGILAAPMFASSVVSMPLLLDRRISLLQAVLTSWRVVLANPIPMAVWAAVLMVLTLLGFATLMLGLVVIIPLLGHASWHAYRDLVDSTALPAREAYSVPYVRPENR